MDSKLNIKQDIGYRLVPNGPRGIESAIRFNNRFSAMHMRLINGVYQCIDIVEGHNDVTVVGKNHLLDVTFGNSSPVTQVTPWYIGLIDQSPVPTLSENDTLSSHTGWNEHTAYTGNRIAWDDANAASKVKGTTTTSDFTINASGEVNGIFVCSVATTTTGILWATGSFDSSVPVVNTDVLKITYGIRT